LGFAWIRFGKNEYRVNRIIGSSVQKNYALEAKAKESNHQTAIW
jgi:hypothetical protein